MLARRVLQVLVAVCVGSVWIAGDAPAREGISLASAGLQLPSPFCPTPPSPGVDSASLASGRTPSAPRAVAIATERIERDRRTIRVYRAGQLVELPRFHELLVATAVERQAGLESLVGKTVAVVRSAKRRGEWEVHADVAWGIPLNLPENVFGVKQVLPSSAKQPIEVRVNGKVHRVKAGQVLIVLG